MELALAAIDRYTQSRLENIKSKVRTLVIAVCVRFADQRAIQTGFFIGIIKRVKEESAAGRAPYGGAPYGAPPPYGAYAPPPYGAYAAPPSYGVPYGGPPPRGYGGPPAPPCASLHRLFMPH